MNPARVAGGLLLLTSFLFRLCFFCGLFYFVWFVIVFVAGLILGNSTELKEILKVLVNSPQIQKVAFLVGF